MVYWQNLWCLMFQSIKATPVYLSEIAPPKWRGAFNAGFQFFIGVGVVAANCINYGTARHTWGWRLSLGLAIVPTTIMTIGAFLIPDTPSSLVERGKIDQPRHALIKVRGPTIDVEHELEQVIRWSRVSKSMEQESFMTIFEKLYRPQLVMVSRYLSSLLGSTLSHSMHLISFSPWVLAMTQHYFLPLYWDLSTLLLSVRYYCWSLWSKILVHIWWHSNVSLKGKQNNKTHTHTHTPTQSTLRQNMCYVALFFYFV